MLIPHPRAVVNPRLRLAVSRGLVSELPFKVDALTPTSHRHSGGALLARHHRCRLRD